MVDCAGEAMTMTIPRTNRILLLLTFLLISTSFVRAETIPGLGTATFPTSTHSAAADARIYARFALTAPF